MNDQIKFQKASQLAFVRQKSIESFLSFGGKIGNGVLSSLQFTSTKKRSHVSCHSSPRNFTRDPKVLTHPLYITSLSSRGCHRSADPKPCNHHPLSLDQLIQKIYSSKLTAKLTLQTYNNQLNLNRMGIVEFSLDYDGALLAVGHESGYISVYDLDEVFLQVMNNPRMIPLLTTTKPLLSLDTKKSIGRIIWRKSLPDDIFVSFSFAPQIHHFSLSQVSFSAPTSSSPVTVFLPEGKGNQGGGHRCMVLWMRKFQTPKVTREDEYIIAGSTNGYLRCWKVSSNGGQPPQRSVNKGIWNIRNDVSRPKELARPIIAVFLLPYYPLFSKHQSLTFDDDISMTHLLAVTDDGLFTVWDIVHLVPGSFGSTGNEPKFITSFNLADRLLLSPSNSRLIRSVQREDKRDNAINRLVIQLEDGSVFLFDLFNLKLLGSPYQYHSTLSTTDEFISETAVPQALTKLPLNPPTTSRLGDAVITSSYEGLGQALSQRSLIAQLSIPAQYCSLPSNSSQLSDIIILPSCSLSPGQLPSSIPPLQRVSLSLTYHNPYTHESTSSYYQSRTSLYHRNLYTGLIVSSLQRCTSQAYTLPGFIISAVKGEKEVLVSVDLQGYLGNDYVSTNCMSRSNDIRIEYVESREEESVLAFKDYTVETIRQNYVQLATPYDGPEVVQGSPRVWIRTNLMMKGWSNDSYYHSVIIDQADKRPAVIESSGSMNAHWPDRKDWDVTSSLSNISNGLREDVDMSSMNPVVALFHHPYYPLLLVGRLDDSITVMTYEGNYSFTEEEENQSRSFRSNQVVHYNSGSLGIDEAVAPEVETVEEGNMEENHLENEEITIEEQGNDQNERKVVVMEESVLSSVEFTETMEEENEKVIEEPSSTLPAIRGEDSLSIPLSLQDRRDSLKAMFQSNSRSLSSVRHDVSENDDAVMSTVKSLFAPPSSTHSKVEKVTSRLVQPEGRENVVKNAMNATSLKRGKESEMMEEKKKRKLSNPVNSSSNSSNKITQFFTKK